MSFAGVSAQVNRVIAGADRLQRRHSVLGFPYAVAKKYDDDEGGREAALITYYGFAGPVYGSFATVAGMLSLLYLLSQALVYAAEIAAVRHARLWPRALDLSKPTAADTRALALLAREQERVPAARVELHLVTRGSSPANDSGTQ